MEEFAEKENTCNKKRIDLFTQGETSPSVSQTPAGAGREGRTRANKNEQGFSLLELEWLERAWRGVRNKESLILKPSPDATSRGNLMKALDLHGGIESCVKERTRYS